MPEKQHEHPFAGVSPKGKDSGAFGLKQFFSMWKV